MQQELPQRIPRNVEEVFINFKGRRAGIIKALTTEADKFLEDCYPENVNLCLYGYPDGSWKVKESVEQVLQKLPEPAAGINFARDKTKRADMLCLVAAHSYAWLLSVSLFYAFGFTKNERMRLFNMINELPSVVEVVLEAIGHDEQRQTAVNEDESCKNDEEDNTCGSCGDKYGEDEFWICCDFCEIWYHGKCVNVTPVKAESINYYRCPRCSKKKVTTKYMLAS